MDQELEELLRSFSLDEFERLNELLPQETIQSIINIAKNGGKEHE